MSKSSLLLLLVVMMSSQIYAAPFKWQRPSMSFRDIAGYCFLAFPLGGGVAITAGTFCGLGWMWMNRLKIT
ncbi:MAG: hypothetical protein WCK49_00010 [Myxococcaceae bacterium]